MATGNTLVTLYPQDNEPPASNFATLDTRNGHPVLDFDDGATNERAVWSFILPRHYAGGGLTVYLHYSMTSDVANKVRLEAAFERIGDGSQDVDSDGFAAAQGVNVAAVPGTAGHVDIASIAFTDGAQIDSIAVGELCRIYVERDSSDATNDTAVGDLELHAIEIKET